LLDSDSSAYSQGDIALSLGDESR